MLPARVVRERCVLPVSFDGETILVASPDADDLALADHLRFLSGHNVRMVQVNRRDVQQAIDRHHPPPAAKSKNRSSRRERLSLERSLAGHGHAMHAAPQQDSDSHLVSDAAIGWLGHGDTDGLAERLMATQMAPGRNAQEDRLRQLRAEQTQDAGLDFTSNQREQGMFYHVVEEGQRALMTRANGAMDVVVGPQQVWRGLWNHNKFQSMHHHVAHPGEYLLVRFRDGRQTHLPGPTDVWFDPREHLRITREEGLQLSAKEAVVAYSKSKNSDEISRRIVYGPALFVPEPNEWLHTFSWHASQGGSEGVQKIPNGLVFQKLWLMPDQMYHDVTDVRTADDAVITIRLMIFFELLDIERMLDTTHDPIGDFVNAATSDVVEFAGKHDFESFKQNTHLLNELGAYKQLDSRAQQCGYRINKVVYRGYGAATSLQRMHDEAIEARTRLQLERATEQQAQDVENYKLDCQLERSGKRRGEQTNEVEHDLELARKRQEAELSRRDAQERFVREQDKLESELQREIHGQQDAQQREHLASLRELGVDLTSFLTQSRADRVIELRGGAAGTHVHLAHAESQPNGNGS
ncbi:MAG: hypothetical protein N2C14_24595, partial [Planctomycetales bacterium]